MKIYLHDDFNGMKIIIIIELISVKLTLNTEFKIYYKYIEKLKNQIEQNLKVLGKSSYL